MPLRVEDVGRRVVVRRRLPRPVAGHTLTDVLGELVSFDGEAVVVRRSDGTDVTVPISDVVAAKVVPAAAVRRSVPGLDGSVADLERMAARGWRALEEVRLGDWLLRAADGFTGRANSVLPVGDPGRPLDEALRAVRRFYAERGLTARFQVPLPLATDLDAALAADGWTAFDDVHFLVAGTADVLRAHQPRPGPPPVVLLDTPDDTWLSGYLYRGTELPAGAIRVLTNAERPVFAAVRDGTGQLAVGRGVVHDGWLGVTAVTVAEAGRRQGLGRQVMLALLHWGREQGARSVYLQVAGDNTAALALYDGLGFTLHHHYHYRREDS